MLIGKLIYNFFVSSKTKTGSVGPVEQQIKFVSPYTGFFILLLFTILMPVRRHQGVVRKVVMPLPQLF